MKRKTACGLLALLAATPPASAETVRLRAEKVETVISNDGLQRKELKISLTDESSRKLGLFTSRHVGQQVDIAIAGKHILSPRVMTPIFSRSLTLGPLAYSDTEITTMKERMLASDAIALSSHEP